MSAGIAVNGRFRTQALTGVQRFAGETARALAELAPVELICPEASGGQVWEQMVLPRLARGRILLNLGNTAPLALRRQVLVIHDAAAFAVPEAYSWRFRTLYRGLQRALVWRGVALATVSDFSRGQVARHLGVDAAGITVLGEGAEHILRMPADGGLQERIGLARPYVLAVGSLAVHKNLAILSATAAMLAQRGHDLVLVGDLDGRVLRAAGMPQPARLTGRVDDAGLRALYEGASCFVFPSRHEGFGLPAVEAMACGCPVVAARAGALPEVCGDAALLCDPADAGGFASAVAAVLDQPETASRLRTAGFARSAGFTWDRPARALLDLALRLEAGR